MTDPGDGPEDRRAPSSPPCMAHEIGDGMLDPHRAAAGPTPGDVAAWRRQERARLRAERMAMGVEDRRAAGAALADHLLALLAARFGGARGRVLSAYWPIKGEPDLRPLMADLHADGVVVALPIVEVKAAPLVFRRWTPETAMVRGDWNIPVPPPEAEALRPEIALAPLVGWDPAGYRLGYGGGYFDRTLAALDPRAVAIGIGFEAARIATIHPQPHDVVLDAILTEAGLRVDRTGSG